MKAVGIICEFNPFHNGHKYLIDSVREQLAPDAVVCIMSGNYVQRGETALISKWARAEMAVKNGIDLVIELPTLWSTSYAQRFAEGGVSLLYGVTGSGKTSVYLKLIDDVPIEKTAFEVSVIEIEKNPPV